MPHHTALRELAERLGILSSYLSQDGSQLRSTSDETRVAILAAMGYDASSEERVRALLAELDERDAQMVAEPVCVVRGSELHESGQSEGELHESELHESELLESEPGDSELRGGELRGGEPRDSGQREAGAGGLRFHVPESWGIRVGERVEYVIAIREDEGPSPEHARGPVAGDTPSQGRGSARSRSSGARDAAVALEGGGRSVVREGDARLGDDGWFTIALVPPPAPGYYHAEVEISVGARRAGARQRLIVVPDRCVAPARRAYGIIANLYSVRGARSWGVGDLTDLTDLARWSGEHGAAFVGVNPLHALRTVGDEVSPYSPVSRLYRNPAYLDIEAIPELASCAEARVMLRDDSVRAELARIRSSDRVEYARRARLARPILEALHRCFVEGGGLGGVGDDSASDGPDATSDGPDAPSDAPDSASDALDAESHGSDAESESPEADDSSHYARRRAYAAYREREGRALDDFAVFTALDEHFARGGKASITWDRWPAEYRSADSPAVRQFARTHAMEIDFHRWLQFELDRQLAAAAAAGAKAGLSIGLYQDLAVASVPYGSDVWARPELHAHGVSVGAPPDDYSATGQNWGLTPLDPHRLRADGYRFWTAFVRSALEHAGAIRIDHVLGLFRQFWIPSGKSGSDGAYVRFPTDDLMGILALESARHGAVIVGEDLGTVPPEVPGTLHKWGILGTRVLLFERERDLSFRPASSYEPLALATAVTHDLPTLAGFWEGRDVALAARLGRFPSSTAEDAALRSRQNDRRLLADRLLADGAIGADECITTEKLRDAVYRFLCSTPAILVGISLDDLTGETEPVNVPGVSTEHFASWTRRMQTPLTDVIARDDLIPPPGCGGPRTAGSGLEP